MTESEQNNSNDRLLDENISRLLTNQNDAPQIPAERETEMLAQLKAKQAALFPEQNEFQDHDSVKPKSVDRDQSEQKSWSIVLAGGLLIAVILSIWLAVAVNREQPIVGNDGQNGAGNEARPTDHEFELTTASGVKREMLEDGTIIVSSKGTSYKVEKSRHLSLESGELYLIVAKSDKPFVVKTADGEVRATGTRFIVQTGKRTATAVAQGRVTLSNKRGKVQLGAGQQGKLEKGKQPTRGPAPRLSHLVSWAKEALTQEELLVEKAETKDGLIAIDPWGQEVKLTLRKFNIDVYVEDGIARTTIDQTFFNHNPWNTEGTFYFPLPPDASVSRLAMYVAGGLNEGGMVERGRGQDIYANIRYQNRDPALLEMMQGNVFKMRIFPLEGRQEKRVFLSYTQKLEELYGTMRYWFPMDHTNSIAKKLSIHVHVKDGAGTFEAKSSTHQFDMAEGNGDLVLSYSAENAKPDQDLLLHLLPARKIEATRMATCVKDDKHFVFGRFKPEIPGEFEAKPRQWIVLNDVSGSRSKIEIKAQRYIVDRLVKEADDNDSLTIVNLNTKAQTVLRNLSVKEVRPHGFVAKASPAGEPTFVWPEGRRIGATNLAAGVAKVGKLIEELKCDNPHILYLGDGVATDGAVEVFSLVRAIPRKATFIGVGVGKKVDSLFLQSAADQSGGMFTTINPDDDIDWRVFDMIAALNTPRMTKIKVKLLNDAGKEMVLDSIAYPSTRSLAEGETLTVVARCDKELPAKIKVEGKVGKDTESFVVSMDDVKNDAEYIPRLWAKRHIDELTKSDMERKDEIISLSKQYYVVTPLTSLIVLENDAMYAEFKVERGRKDHWALYNAPKKIGVVKEPIDWSKRKWSWYHYGPGDDASIDAKAQPKSIKEIVDSVQFRVNAPFYYSRQQPADGRQSLYQLLDNQGDPTRLLTYWMLMASGDQEAAATMRPSAGNESTSNPKIGAAKNPAHVMLYDKLNKDLSLPMLMKMRSDPNSATNDGLLSSLDLLVARPSLLPNMQQNSKRLAPVEALLGPSMLNGRLRSIRGEMLATGVINASGFYYAPQLGKAAEEALSTNLLFSQTLTTGTMSSVPVELANSFEQALADRWSRINNDIRQFNRQYGYWDNWDGWGYRGWNQGLDLRNSGGVYDNYGGLDELIEGLDGEAMPALQVAEAGDRPPAPELMKVKGLKSLAGYRPMHQVAMAWIGIYGDSIQKQPGIATVLAADYLVERRNELLEQRPVGKVKQELEIVNRAIDGLEKATSRLEDTGPFWGYQGWDYRPQRWTFQAPTVQVYQNYNWSFDFTRYAPGLYSNASDVLDEVIAQYGLPKPQGNVDEKAAKLIKAARTAIEPGKIRFGGSDVEIIFAANDRFQATRQTDMYLEERLICDGKNVLHVYDELGIAARRKATSLRIGDLRQLTPHLLEPVESLAQRFDIKVEREYKGGFDLRLTPIGLAEASKENDKLKPIHMIVSATHRGLVRNKLLFVDDKRELNLAFQHDEDDNQVVVRWFDAEDKELAKVDFSVKRLDAEPSFEANLTDFTVFDMPLRKPSYYAKKIEELGEKDFAERAQLNRHQALAMIQQFHRRRWGQANAEARKCLSEAFEALRQIDTKPTLGDLTLSLSSGRWDAVKFMAQWRKFDDSVLVAKYSLNHNGWQTKDEARSLTTHLASYRAAIQNYKVTPKYAYFKERFPNSPLLLAATFYAANWNNNPSAWSELYGNPQWRGMSLLMSAAHVSTDEHRKAFVEACELWLTELDEAGYQPPISPQVANQLRTGKSNVWAKLVADRLATVKETKHVAPLLTFFEDAMSWGETDAANEALRLARERLEKQKEKPLLGRFALAQSLWASSRPKEALAEYDAILAQLKKDNLPISPALLASIARLAQQSGDSSRAIEFEERALAAEQKYLPDMINIQAFRQRYNWLWQQYKTKIAAAVADDDAGAVKRFMELAESTWQRWFEIDQGNINMVQEMATLQMTVKNNDRSWLYLSTIIDQKPRDASSCSAMSRWYQGRDELDEAQKWLASAFKWETSNPQWLYQRGQLLNQLGRDDEANELYQKVIDGKWAPGLQRWINTAKNALK